MTCKVLINKDSGNCNRLDLRALLQRLSCPDAEIQYINCHTNWNCDNADTVVVCGGDGTLKNALAKCKNKKLIFVPCGTLNESKSFGEKIPSVGKVNDELFSYVCATGSFTEIGYLAKNRNKQKFKSLAYLPLVVKHYVCHDIPATITLDKKNFEGHYTLLMAIKSKRCFGFDFNRCYDKHKGLYLLAVKSFGKNTLVNKIKMFFTFFEIFFCGIDQPKVAKNYFLLPFEKATIQLQKDLSFCLDGEKCLLGKTLHFQKQQFEPPIQVVKTPFAKR